MNGSAHNGSGNGWDHDEPGAIVDAAVEAVGRRDPEAGQWAGIAADFMTGGQGVGTITQPRLQEFLWSALPRKFPQEDWALMVEGTARLLDQLGLTRYAGVARSEVTRSVLATWEADDDEGFDRYRAEMDRSGLTPPATELIEWGDFMGIEEAMAYDAVGIALEAAITAGELEPGASGWRIKAADVEQRTLDEQARPLVATDLRRYRRLDLVLGSRVEQWIIAAHDDRGRELRKTVATRFMDGPVAVAPDPPPTDALAAALAPMTWLLDVCRDGVKATATGYLDPAVVREGSDQFGWWPFRGQPRSEADVYPLVLLHEIATRNRWLIRRSRRIRTTKRALALLDDPTSLWWAMVRTVGGESEFTAMVGEFIAIRLLEGPAEHIGLMDQPSELATAVSEVMLTQGWLEDKQPITLREVDAAIHEPLGEWRLFGLLDEPPLTREALSRARPTVALSDTGRIAAVAHLYTRATQARRHILD